MLCLRASIHSFLWFGGLCGQLACRGAAQVPVPEVGRRRVMSLDQTSAVVSSNRLLKQNPGAILSETKRAILLSGLVHSIPIPHRAAA
jgi:hypothetical protein